MIYPNEEQLTPAVALHYDSLDPWYRRLWGEHVHHGYWETGKETPDEAVEKLVDLVANRAAIKEGGRVCDIGCGYGGAARLLSLKRKAAVTGFSVSSRQIEQARQLDSQSTYYLRDWLENGMANASFDAAIAIESSEHMTDKQKFFDEAARVLRPGGKVSVAAWLSKENPRPWQIQFLLEPICREGRLPSLGTPSEYRMMMERAGFKNVVFEDLSTAVRKTWAICGWRVVKALREKEFRRFLFEERPKDRIFAKTIFRILFAYWTRSMAYGLFSAKRP